MSWETDAEEEEVWVDTVDGGDRGEYPIQYLSYRAGIVPELCNQKAIPFLALLVRLGIEFN